MFESAKWIGRGWHSKVMNYDNAPLFRKKIEIKSKVREARLHVCGLGLALYYLDGKAITEDVLITPYTYYDKTVLYQTYEISNLLTEGKHAVGVILGNGFYNDPVSEWGASILWRDNPKLILQLDIAYENGETDCIVSDTSFTTNYSPITYNHMRCGERYDSNLEIEDWCSPDFDDSKWDKAVIARHPGGKIKQNLQPPIRICEAWKCEETKERYFDAKQNISGWVKVTVKGAPGQEVKISYFEHENIVHSQHEPFNDFNKNSALQHTDCYVIGKDGVGSFAPHFVYHGFRYVSIEPQVEVLSVEAQFVHTDMQEEGSFYCSDEMLNRIHKAVRYSTLSNYVGIPTDCPHREQNGWTGDAQLSAEQTIMNFDVKSSYSKWLADIRDGQRESGQIPCVVPSAACYNWGTGPAWDAALILIPYYYFQLTGDKELIEENYDSMVKYVSFMCSMQDDYIVSFGLGEWCGNRSTRIPHNKILDTYYSYLIADAMIINSRVLHKEEKAKEYELLADCIKNAYRRHFILSDYPYDESQILLSCAIDSGLLTDEEKTEAAAKLNSLIVANDYHMDCGILGNKHIYNALSENGYCETAYKMVVNPTYPSMAHWILSGMTTLCECWEMTTSLNHHMFSEVDMWMYKYLAGIRIQSGEITINPCFIKNLDFVKAKHRDISVEWDKKKLTVDVPKRTTVILNDEKIIVEKGKYTFSL